MSINSVVIIGRLGRNPELQAFDSGNAVCSFTLAVDRGLDKNGDDQGPVWVPCKVWGRPAQNAVDLLAKGSKVAVNGRLELEEWTSKTGDQRSRLVVVAYRFELCSPRPGTVQPVSPATQELPF